MARVFLKKTFNKIITNLHNYSTQIIINKKGKEIIKKYFLVSGNFREIKKSSKIQLLVIIFRK